MLPRLAWNFQFSCFRFRSAEITGAKHHVQQCVFLSALRSDL
jgi:hypothetical protein